MPIVNLPVQIDINELIDKYEHLLLSQPKGRFIEDVFTSQKAFSRFDSNKGFFFYGCIPLSFYSERPYRVEDGNRSYDSAAFNRSILFEKGIRPYGLFQLPEKNDSIVRKTIPDLASQVTWDSFLRQDKIELDCNGSFFLQYHSPARYARAWHVYEEGINYAVLGIFEGEHPNPPRNIGAMCAPLDIVEHGSLLKVLGPRLLEGI
ncbi:MAG: hypothetical protein HGA85_08220 [Nanoarchaeota archaeon]|nr:hypothetical protein [Nanoarchaeota archaeon]